MSYIHFINFFLSNNLSLITSICDPQLVSDGIIIHNADNVDIIYIN